MSAVIDDLATATPINVRMTKIIAAVLGKIPLAEINKVNGFTERIQRMKQRYLASRPTICRTSSTSCSAPGARAAALSRARALV